MLPESSDKVGVRLCDASMSVRLAGLCSRPASKFCTRNAFLNTYTSRWTSSCVVRLCGASVAETRAIERGAEV